MRRFAPRSRPGLAPLALVWAALVTPSQAQTDDDVSAAVEGILGEARAACASFENGEFYPGDAVVEIDLTGEGDPAVLVDESRFACSSAASMYCGTGGCMLRAVVGDRIWSFQAEGWRMIDWNGRPILLIARDGTWCGGAGAQICFEAVVWSFGEMRTVMSPRE